MGAAGGRDGKGTFVGRARELALLGSLLRGVRSTGEGRLVVLRGRRQVGKSRLVEEFCRHSKTPYVYFQATKGRRPRQELAALGVALEGSSLAAADLARETRFESWEAALGFIARSAGAAPVIVVLDEVPWLIESDPEVEGALQTAWDRHVRAAPVLLILIGSDISMMEALTTYGRPLYDRARVVPLDPLPPSDVARLLHLESGAALDAYCVVGGFPNVVRTWGPGRDLRRFLSEQLAEPTSPLIVSGERALAAEFPPEAQARVVLEAIGSGEREHGAISSRSGIGGGSLERALHLLTSKRVVGKMAPYSSRSPGRTVRYVVAEPYLRFWLRFVGPHLSEIERGRGELVARRVLADWPAWRGMAVEPIVLEALTRLLPNRRFGAATHVGTWWSRDRRVQVDLVGGVGAAEARPVCFVGSVKWRERAPFDDRDLAALIAQSAAVPGVDPSTPKVAVSRTGSTAKGPVTALGPNDLLAAW